MKIRDFSLITKLIELEKSNSNVLLEYRQRREYELRHKSTVQFITILNNGNRYELEINTPKKTNLMIENDVDYNGGISMLIHNKNNKESDEYTLSTGERCKMYTKLIGVDETKEPVYRLCIEIFDGELKGLYIGYSSSTDIDDFRWAMNNY